MCQHAESNDGPILRHEVLGERVNAVLSFPARLRSRLGAFLCRTRVYFTRLQLRIIEEKISTYNRCPASVYVRRENARGYLQSRLARTAAN